MSNDGRKNDWNENFSKTSSVISSNKSNMFSQTVEIEFDDNSAPKQQKSAAIQKLYEPQVQTYAAGEQNKTPEKRSNAYSYDLDGSVLMTCRIEEWSKGFSLFGDFIRDAKKYYKKTCINANYIYFFSYRPMYRELSHEQLCWYLFWRSKIRERVYPKTGLSYIFLYLYEQINLSDIISHEKVYENMVRIWKNYRAEFPRIDKYIAEWLIDFTFINKIKINLNDIEDILPDIINIVTIPEIYLKDDFFKNKKNIGLIMKNMSVYDHKKSKFYNEKNKELFDYHIVQILHSVLSGEEFEEIIKKETEDGVKIKTTRESFMGAVCVYEHKKRITVEYKNLYKNFFVRQCITDTVRYAENVLRDYLNIKSKLTVTAFPEQLKRVIEEYRNKYLTVAKPQKITVKTKSVKKNEEEEKPETVEFSPNIEAAAEIEKSSWDTTMTLVELQSRSSPDTAVNFTDDIENIGEDDGEFIAIDTGKAENYAEIENIAPLTEDSIITAPDNQGDDIFDILENLKNPGGGELTDMGRFIADLDEEEHMVLRSLLQAKIENKSFDTLCGEFLSPGGRMFESVIDTINDKAMNFTGDIVFDTGSQDIIEDYRGEIERYL